MQTPWHEMSFLQKLWAVAKALASSPVSYTPTNSCAVSFDEDDSITCFTFDDDSPTRGLWDPTSIYYSSMHDEGTTSHSSFDQ